MTTKLRKIVAIGGGEIGRPKEDGNGNYPIETSLIDKEIFELTKSSSPSLLFIPTASKDSLSYYSVVKKHFIGIGFKSVDVLCLLDESPTKQHIKNAILSHDAIYVGGGNTQLMLAAWRELGVDEILSQAFQKGVVLSGISAGSICWFNTGISDSNILDKRSGGHITVKGLGFLDAIHSPHFDVEQDRHDQIKRVTKNSTKVAICLDNCTAIEIVGDKYRLIKSKESSKAYKAYWENKKYYIQEIDSTSQFNSLEDLLKK